MVPFRPTWSSLISPSAKVTIVTCGEVHPLEETGRVLLVSADAIKRLRVDQIEAASACILHEELDPRSNERSTRDGAVAVDLHQLVPVPLQAFAAETDLVINARCTLQVGTVPGVDDSAHGSALVPC